jgi:hypothetical protein
MKNHSSCSFSPRSLLILSALALIGFLPAITSVQARIIRDDSAATASIGPVLSATWSETGDAGSLPATAQNAGGTPFAPLTAITGTLTLNLGISEADMYEIYINSPTTFSATTTGFSPGVNNFDTQLFLFDLTGHGIYANDDDTTSGGPGSTLPAGTAFMSSLPAGFYYILITGSGQFPADSLGRPLFPNFTTGADPTGVFGPTGTGGANAIAGYTGNSTEGGNYSIALTGAQVVPEPSIVGLMLPGIAGLLLLQSQRAKRKR